MYFSVVCAAADYLPPLWSDSEEEVQVRFRLREFSRLSVSDFHQLESNKHLLAF